MKKCFLCILLALSLCLAACGGESGTSAAPTHVFTESVESVTEHVAAFLASDGYQSASALYEQMLSTKSGGCLLEKAMEYHLHDFNGMDADALLLSFQTDAVSKDGAIHDRMQVYVDLNTGNIYDNITENIDTFMMTFDGNAQTEEALRNVLMNVLYSFTFDQPVFYHGSEGMRSLTADEIAAVNAALSLSYNGYASTAEAETAVDAETGIPLLTTDADELIARAIETATALYASPAYQNAALDPLSLHIDAAMEYKMDNFEGFPVHVLLVSTDAIDRDLFNHTAGVALYDMASGAIYTESDFASLEIKGIGNYTCIEDVFLTCLMNFEIITSGRDTQLWSPMEATRPFSEAELDAVNAALSDMLASEAASRDAALDANAAALSGLSRTVFDAARALQGSPRFREVAFDPRTVALIHATEVTIESTETDFSAHFLLLKADGVDTDRYGFGASIALYDLTSGTLYTDADLDLDNMAWDISKTDEIDPFYAVCILCYENIVSGMEKTLILPEFETLMHLPVGDLAAVNAALQP